jgi:hypothetical protein
VTEESVLDRSVAPANEAEVMHASRLACVSSSKYLRALSVGRTAQPPSRCGSFSAIETAYQSLTAPTRLGTATSELLSQMDR